MFLALKEMKRAKVRFGLLIGAVALLAFLILFIQSLTSSLITQFIGALRNQSAQVLVLGADARKNLEGSVITPAEYEAVVAVPGVGESGPLGVGTFTVTADAEQQDASIFGYRLGGPGAPTTLTEGRLPEADFEAVASSRDAGKGFGIGDTVRLEPGGPEITVVGLAEDINYSVAPTMFVSFDTYVEARKTRNPDAQQVYPSAVALQPASGTSSSALAAAVNEQVAGVDALTRSQAVSESPGVASVSQSLNAVVLVAGLIALIVIGFFFVILTVQKSSALTLLRAVGAPSGYLVKNLVGQVVLVVAGGFVVAVLALLALSAVFTGDVKPQIDWPVIIGTGVVIVAFSVIASLGAIRRVLKIDPIRATQTAGANT